MKPMKQPVVLIVMDGYGISPNPENNPIAMAKKPNLDSYVAQYPYGVLSASGLSVGLPWGEVGNSEVGHLNLGAGMVLYQNLPRVSLSIDNGTFFDNPAFLKAAEHVKTNGSSLHILGIASPGGVHGHIDHCKALLKFAKQQKIKSVFLHLITDGRDSPPRATGSEYLADLESAIKEYKTGTIASLCGRYYSMDRNTAWDRTQKGYDLITKGTGAPFTSAREALEAAYAKNLDDEMLEPVCIVDKKGAPVAIVKDNDAVIFFNFRPDRARQIAQSIAVEDFKEFERGPRLANLCFVTMTEYEAGLPADVAFAPEHIKVPFGKVIADKGMKQLRIAETEKYAHVTYFFNGGEETQYNGEDRTLVPSPRVKTYDLKPEMSAYEVADKLVAAIESKKYDFCLVNFANCDMVGHTGNLEATIKGIEAVDECVGKVVAANFAVGGVTLITADHGNAEGVVDPMTGAVDKEHSTSVVPLMLIDESRRREKAPEEVEMLMMQINEIGILADVAPTMCTLLGITPPPEMTGRDLLNDLM